MKHILVIGAGRSSSVLIKYLLRLAGKECWKVTIGDVSESLAKEKVKNHPCGKAIAFDINNQHQREKEILNTDIVISLLPAHLHLKTAHDCIRFKKNMVTASYVSEDMQKLNKDAEKAGVLIMNEIGLDPGIDHMSAIKIIEEVKAKGGKIKAFKSYCGGLIAPESNDNPWGYKFTWNPRNVVLAGQGTAKYFEDGSFRYVPYNRLFKQVSTVSFPGYGEYEAYPNRDSLSYINHYGLENVPTILRATLRNKGFCEAWNVFVKLGLTDDSYQINTQNLTYSQLLRSFLPVNGRKNEIKKDISDFLNLSKNFNVIAKLKWIGIFKDRKIDLGYASPAQILQNLLESKWKLRDTDIDMILLQHHFEYLLKSKKNQIISSLIVKGKDTVETAMAQTVGLPMAIVSKLLLKGKIKIKGVKIPVIKEVYIPVLNELSDHGINFIEEHKTLKL